MVDNKKLSVTASERLELLRFPLIVCVVFIHASETTVHLSDQVIGVREHAFAAGLVMDLISQCLARTAVPLYFLIAGYLFFLGFEWSWQNYLAKLKTRVRTLLIPFLFWNLLTLAMWGLFQHWSVTQSLFSGSHVDVARMGWRDGMAAIWGIGREPIAYQFWFIRDLMALVVLTPLIAALLHNKAVASVTLVVLFLCRTLGWWFGFPSIEATSLFVLGGFLACSGIGLFVVDTVALPLMLLYPVVLVADAVTFNDGMAWFHKFDSTLGVAVFLCLSATAHRYGPIRRSLLALSLSSFFIYAAHEPLLMLSRKMAYKLLAPESDWSVLGLYFMVPIAVIGVLLLTRRGLLRVAPGFMSLITGGR
jgi:surface polysaccharide O-acyltransferase-like enzyme